MGLLGLGAFASLVYAEDDDDWPDTNINFPAQSLPAQPAAPVGEQVWPIGVSPPATDHKSASKPKKGFWPFNWGKKNAKDKLPPPTEDQIVKVGPRELPVSPDPLLCLPMPVFAGSGVVPAGFYLMHLPAGNSNGAVEVVLFQQGKAVLRLMLHAAGNADEENRAITGTASPLQKVSSGAPPTLKAEARLTADQQAMVLVLRRNEQRFESDPLPLAVDRRPVTGF